MNLLSIGYYVIFPLISIIILPIIRNYINSVHERINSLEQIIQTKLNEEEIRQIIADRIEPVKESLDQLHLKIEKLTEYLINRTK